MHAHIRYTVDTGEPLVNETFGPNNIRRRSLGTEEARSVDIRDPGTPPGAPPRQSIEARALAFC